MWPLAVLLVISIVTLLGDYLIKKATGTEQGLLSLTFLVGMLFYGLPAVGWFYLMKSHSLAMLGVLYASSTVLLMAALGVFVFREAFGLREAIGVSLAVASILIMSLSE
ncbi:hypothetical protein [Rhodobacter sp. NSM]|uniref:hypothetical protein n=1 Tax=Rhodobacter sp. NSM TaxID=3457501 RepID=UPI003FD5893A